METVKLGEDQYGLTMAAIEQVAQQGLASITHMHLQVKYNRYMLYDSVASICLVIGHISKK